MDSLTIILPTHGRPTLLERTLDSIAQCELPSAYGELIVVENGSRVGAEQIVRQLPERLNARYMHRERGNKSYALNEALETAADGLIVFFDDDVCVEPKTLVAYSEAAEKYGPRHFFGGPVRVDYERRPPGWLRSQLPLSEVGYDVDKDTGKNFYLGFNWAAFTHDINRLGGFDPRFGPGATTGATGQEADMQQRLFGDGCTSLNVEDAVVFHYVPEDHCTLYRVIERKYRLGIHKSIKQEKNIKGTLYSIIAFTVSTIKNILKLKRKKVVSGISNISYQFGILSVEIK